MARTQGSHAQITGPRMRAAALRLFAEQGYAAVSMRRIAAEVGVQVGALYNYTSDKQALLYSLLEAHMRDLLEARRAVRRPGPARVRLEAFVRFHIAYHLERPQEVFISYMELRNLSDRQFAAIEDLRRAYEDDLEDILRAGRAEGVFAVADTKIATLGLIALLTGVTTWYRPDGRLSVEEVTAIYIDMARKAVAA